MTSPLTNLLSSPSPDWQAVLEACITAFAGSTGTLHRLDPADGMLKLLAQRGIPPQLMPVVQVIPVGKGIAGAAAERREPVELCNLQQDLGGVAKEGARQTNVQGSLAVPCLHGDELRGTLGVGMMTPHDFSEEEKTRLMDLGREIAANLC
jgi:putative methionine-R-sulfoxide reductase with GAF domain